LRAAAFDSLEDGVRRQVYEGGAEEALLPPSKVFTRPGDALFGTYAKAPAHMAGAVCWWSILGSNQ
jgi:hypothetical protein